MVKVSLEILLFLVVIKFIILPIKLKDNIIEDKKELNSQYNFYKKLIQFLLLKKNLKSKFQHCLLKYQFFHILIIAY